MTTFTDRYLAETGQIIESIDATAVEGLAEGLAQVRERSGRLFILGVGGSAGHASHAVNDFRKLCGIEAYTPVDNVSELTARINDEGWETCFSDWLKGSRIAGRDGILVFSQPGALPAASLAQLIAAVRDLDMDAVRAEVAAAEATATTA